MVKHLKLKMFCMFILLASFQVRAQQITLQMQNVTVKEAIEALKEKTKKSFFFEVNDIDLNKKVSVKIQDGQVEEAIKQILVGQNLHYEVKGDYIVITKTKPQEIVQQSISGIVTDSKKEPLIGVTISVPDLKGGTVTDAEGEFTLNIPNNTSLIRVSYVGFATKEVAISKNMSYYNIILEEEDEMLSEVVVVGYGTQKKENLTGAVSVVTGEELASRSAPNVSQLLQGTVPNMNVTFSSGRPGATGSFNIRGINSISQNASPLVMIDGVEGDINRLNPNDVESVTVLKDASASAVYGARASYGVILITTKSGENNNKMSLTYNGRYSFGKPTVSTDYETRGYYSAGINDMFFSTYQGSAYTTYTEKDYYEMWIRRDDKTEHPDRPWVVVEDGQYKYYANTDWYNYLYDDTRPTQEHNVSLGGGTDKLKYFLSGNFYEQEGMLRITPDKYKKYNFRSKVTAELKPWLKVSNNTSYFYSSYFYPGNGGVNTTFDRSTAHALASFVPVNPDGTLVYLTTNNTGYEVTNGASAILTHNGHHNKDKYHEFTTSFEAVLTPVKNLDIIANYNYIYYNRQDVNRSVDVNYSKDPGVVLTMPESMTGGSKLYEAHINNWSQAYNIYGVYSNKFNEVHNVKITSGINSENKRFKDVKISRNGMLTDELDDFNLAKGDVFSLTGGKNNYSIFGVFYRLNYDYQSKYLFEASGRYDGSSRFRKGHRYGFFPSFSAGWRISEEQFFTPLRTTIDNLKLRLSYGSLGNQQVGYYDYIQQINTGSLINYTFGDGVKAPSATETAPNSLDMTWETVVTKNLGLDIGLLNNRLTITPDVYVRDTKDMLTVGRKLPASYGASSPKMNAADLRTKGWEIAVAWNDSFNLKSKPFNYSVSVGLGDNTTKITKYDNPTKLINDPYVGQQLGQIWGYVVDGYFKTDEEAANYHVDQSYVNEIINVSYIDKGLHAGDMKFVDLDGDNVISPTTNADDVKDQKVIGNSLPRYNYNANFSANWNGVDLSVFFQGIGKQNWYPGSNALAFWGPYSRPYATYIPSDFLSKVWSEDNPDAYFPRPRGYIALSTSRRSLGVANTKYLQDLAYCRLKNLTVGYTLPSKWLNKIQLEKVRVYFSGENLLTFTKLESDYIDPEQAAIDNSYNKGTSDAKVYPWNKTFSFGIDITF